MFKGNPNLEDVFEIVKEYTMAFINCSRIGRIRSFNPENCTAYIDIMELIPNNGNNEIPSILADVPVIFYGSRNTRITPPDIVGSNCLLIFQDRNIDNFLTTGEQYEPDNDRTHSYADCVALLTLNSYIDEPVMYDENALTLYNGTQFAKIFNDSIELYAEKIKLYNSQTTLLTLIKSLITEIKNITVNTSTSSTQQAINNKAAFNTIATDFEGLLE